MLTINFKHAEPYKCYPIKVAEVENYLDYFADVCSTNNDKIISFTHEQFNESEIKIGDKYINVMSPEMGIRIADEETLKRVKFAKSVNYGTCYYKKAED